MKVYHVLCEGVVTRQITVEAANSAEAITEARQEFASLLGASKNAVAIISVDRHEDTIRREAAIQAARQGE